MELRSCDGTNSSYRRLPLWYTVAGCSEVALARAHYSNPRTLPLEAVRSRCMALIDCCSAASDGGWHISPELAIDVAAMQAFQKREMLIGRAQRRASVLCAVAEQDGLQCRRGAKPKLSAQDFRMQSRHSWCCCSARQTRRAAFLSVCPPASRSRGWGRAPVLASAGHAER